MRPSQNVIEHTWVGYAFDAPVPMGEIEGRLRRVGDHYGSLLADSPLRSAQLGQQHGMALWQREDPRLRWPLFVEADGLAMASPGLPTGWQRITGSMALEAAPTELARKLNEDPTRSADLNPPALVGLRDTHTDRLTILTDLVGVARAYEMRTSGGWVWSNRLGALPLFAGAEPSADVSAWQVFAAAGWFLGTDTPIAGTSKLPAATVLKISTGGPDGGLVIERSQMASRHDLVRPRRAKLRDSAAEAADGATNLAEELGRCWTEPVAISLTGGRDSRVSAAAAIAAGVAATYNTGDQIPGEVDVVRELVAKAPVEMRHTVHHPELDEGERDALDERVGAIHLVHDGMRNPQEVRRPMEIPHRETLPPTLSGHGGELGHGFYYGTASKLRRLRREEDALAKQLERNARRKHSAATEEAYGAYMTACSQTLDEGRQVGLSGPELLDWFYLAQRLPYRSGLGARTARWSACVTPAFIRGAFDLSPKERLTAKLHCQVLNILVPQWRRIEFFKEPSDAMPEISRRRIWEREDEAAVVERMLSDGRASAAIFDVDRLRQMWRDVRAGQGSADYEHIFDRVVWQVGFDEHLELLAARSRAG